MASSVTKAMADVESKVLELLKTHDDDGGFNQLRSKADVLISLLLDNNLARKERIDNKYLRPHKHNRFKTGLDPLDVHALLHRVVAQGWSWSKVGVA
eukprot:8800630-Pyramimonas_sp.AAC.1